MTIGQFSSTVRVAWDFPAAGHVSGLQTSQSRDQGYSEAFKQLWVAYEQAEVAGVLRQAHAASLQGDTVVGWVAYDASPAFDSALMVKDRGETSFPLAFFASVDTAPAGRGLPAASSSNESFHMLEPWADIHAPAHHRDRLDSIREDIAAGRFYQVNYTTRMHAKAKGSAWAIFQNLRQWQPHAYCMMIETEQWAVISVSPELFFDWDGRTCVTAPMKGTARASASGEAAQQLRDSPKDQAENVMIVDLLRNDMSRIAKPGTVHVQSLFDVQSLPTVAQMTSTIVCQTRDNTTLLDVFNALFPCGSVTGAPKIEAMRAIAEYETQPRGIYCGALGLLRPGGHATFNVPIRTAQWDKVSGQLNYGVGSGVTWYSEPTAELDEWASKVHLLRRAHAGFHLIETLRLDNGQWLRLPLHLKRMQESAAHMGFPFNDHALHQQLTRLAREYAQGAWRTRLLLHSDGRFEATAHPMEATPGAVALLMADKPMDAPSEFLRFKTSWRPHYDRFAPTDPALFDTVLWRASTDDQRLLTECIRGNLVLELDTQLFTPHADGYCLPGIYRSQLVDEVKVLEKDLSLDCLQRATRVWFVNSLRGMIPVSRIQAINGDMVFQDDSLTKESEAT